MKIRRPFKTPLYLKLIIASVVWLIFFGLIHLILIQFTEKALYQYIIWGWALSIWGYNVLILFITHKRLNEDSTIKVEDPKLKKEEPWAI